RLALAWSLPGEETMSLPPITGPASAGYVATALRKFCDVFAEFKADPKSWRLPFLCERAQMLAERLANFLEPEPEPLGCVGEPFADEDEPSLDFEPFGENEEDHD